MAKLAQISDGLPAKTIQYLNIQHMINKKIVYALAAYTIIQFLILYFLGYTPYPDSQGYINIAQETLKYNNQFYPAREQLYTLPFLWNIGAINTTALSLLLTESITPLLIIYTLLKTSTILLTYIIAYRLFGKKTAIATIIMALIYPANYGEATSLLSEVPFVFFTLAAIYACIKGKNLMGGTLMGCAEYFRPFAIIFIMAYILCNIKEWRQWTKMCIAYASVIIFIGTCNYATKQQFIYKAKTGWMALAQYHWDNDPQHKGLPPMALTENHTLTYSEKDNAWRDMFLTWLKDNKKEYIKQIPVKIAKTYVSDNTTLCAMLPQKEKNSTYMYETLAMENMISSFPHFSATQWLAAFNLLYYYTLLLLLLCSTKYIKKLRLTFLIVIIGTIFIALVGHGETRFHIPFMPFIIMAAAYTLIHNSTWKNRS